MKYNEYGSDFHYQPFLTEGLKHSILPFTSEAYSLFFSGRVALFNLLKFGIQRYGWSRVGFPSYYCHEVVEFFQPLPIEVVLYDYVPFLGEDHVQWEDRDTHVFVNVDFFGVKKLDTSWLKHSVVIDDVTHNLTDFRESTADYVFASLRKQLPVATGGFCYAPKSDFVSPPPPQCFAESIAMQKLSAMYLKAEYLRGTFSAKNIYRTLFIEAEAAFQSPLTDAALPALVRAQLEALPVNTLINRTRDNIAVAHKLIKMPKGCRLLSAEGKATEMALVFILPTQELRDALRSHLINASIYPAIPWPNQKQALSCELERRILLVHADFRYSHDDIALLTATINRFFQ